MKQVYIFPRYSGDENSDWYQSIKNDICLGFDDINIIPLSFPNWDKPSTDDFLEFITREIPINKLNINTFFVGHSIGCKAALLYLNELNKVNSVLKIGGLMCVAGWWTVDNPWPQLQQWIRLAINYNGIKYICNNNIKSILSDNDPFTSDWKANKQLWENNLNATVCMVQGAKHFNMYEGLEQIKSELLKLVTK